MQRDIIKLKDSVAKISKNLNISMALCENILRVYVNSGREELLERGSWLIPGVVRLCVESLDDTTYITPLKSFAMEVAAAVDTASYTVERVIREYIREGVIGLQRGFKWVIPNVVSLWLDEVEGKLYFRTRWSEGLREEIQEHMYKLYSSNVGFEYLSNKNFRSEWDFELKQKLTDLDLKVKFKTTKKSLEVGA